MTCLCILCDTDLSGKEVFAIGEKYICSRCLRTLAIQIELEMIKLKKEFHSSLPENK